MRDNKVLEGEKKFHPARFLEILLYRLNYKIACRHIGKYPQIAIFSFDHIGLTINLEGRFEGKDLEILRRFLTDTLNIDTSAAALDIGANIGNHALFFADIFARVIAFEPNPRTFKLLEFNCYDSDVVPLNLGLSSADGALDFLVLPSNVGGSCIVTDTNDEVPREHLSKIQVRRLDALSEVAALEIALIKIDVEGHELDVLRGASETLTRARPVIVFEQLKREIHDGTSDVIEFLRGRDYKFYTIEQNYNFGSNRLMRILGFGLRSVFGFQRIVVQTDHFADKVHDMIIAVPGGRL